MASANILIYPDSISFLIQELKATKYNIFFKVKIMTDPMVKQKNIGN